MKCQNKWPQDSACVNKTQMTFSSNSVCWFRVSLGQVKTDHQISQSVVLLLNNCVHHNDHSLDALASLTYKVGGGGGNAARDTRGWNKLCPHGVSIHRGTQGSTEIWDLIRSEIRLGGNIQDPLEGKKKKKTVWKGFFGEPAATTTQQQSNRKKKRPDQ